VDKPTPRMISRIQLRKILENKEFDSITPSLRISLERSLHIAITENGAPEAQATDAVGIWKEKIATTNDVLRLTNQFLDMSITIPFVDQKIVQWLVAAAYSHGFKNGRAK
jgi:hypothetical protein